MFLDILSSSTPYYLKLSKGKFDDIIIHIAVRIILFQITTFMKLQ